MEGYLTTLDVAKRFGVSRVRIAQLRDRPENPLPAVRAGRIWLYPLESVELFARQGPGRKAVKRELMQS
jgi:hypothetical protein